MPMNNARAVEIVAHFGNEYPISLSQSMSFVQDLVKDSTVEEIEETIKSHMWRRVIETDFRSGYVGSMIDIVIDELISKIPGGLAVETMEEAK